MIRLDDQFIVPRESDQLSCALAELLDLRWTCYRKALKRCRRKFSEKSVHAVRVEIRRMLSMLALLVSVLPPDLIEALEHELKHRLKALSRLRDTHVQIDAVAKMAERNAALEQFHSWLQRKERRLVKRVERQLEQARTGKATRIVRQLTCALQEAEQQDPAHSMGVVLVRATGRAFDSVLARCRQVSPTHIAAIHRTRVAFKKFRYMVEALAEVLPGISDRQLRAMHKYQTRMGKIQDAEVLLARVEKFAKRAGSEQLESVCRQILRRRVRLIGDFVTTADQLLEFWPPDSCRRYSRRSTRVRV